MAVREALRIAGAMLASLALAAPASQAAPAQPPLAPPPKQAEAIGFGGAVTSADPDATRAGVEVLRRGGTATDAAVATAAALGVTEQYSAGLAGGGHFTHYDARTGHVETINGPETAPEAADRNLFVESGQPLPKDQAITSGLSTGVPGTPLTWQDALLRWGSKGFDELLRPAERLAREGFVVDQAFHDQTVENQERFRDFPATRELFLPGGRPPAVGSVLRNPDLADTYRTLAEQGLDSFYSGNIGADVVETVRHPPVDPAADRKVRPGLMTRRDLRDYRTVGQVPTHTRYREFDVFGMGPSSAGGTTVSEALNILEHTDLSDMDKTEYLHRFLESSKISFAERDRWVGDPAFSDVPTEQLTSQKFADSRACLIMPNAVLPAPVTPADPRHPQECRSGTSPEGRVHDSPNTSHLTVADARGNVVSYTLTLEQTGGNGIVVPGRGFLLNNELTDFSFTPRVPGRPDPNLPGPGKRPLSSMSPVIVLRDGEPVLATGSPGGSTILTTTLQVLTGRLGRDLALADAIAAPRASQQNSGRSDAEEVFLRQPEADKLRAIGHRFAPVPEIGAATGVERLPDGRWLAAAEPVRRGGGHAEVVQPGVPGEGVPPPHGR